MNKTVFEMYRQLPYVAIICILLFSTIDGKTTTTKAPTTKKPTTTPNLHHTLPNRTNIITTRFGADGTPAQQCQCTLFYLCNTENTVPLTGEGQSCAENYVCCSIIENLENQVDPLPSDGNNNGGNNGNAGNSSNNGGNSGGVGGFGGQSNGNNGDVGTGGNDGGSSTNVNEPNRPNNNRNCTCVPPDQCYRDPNDATSGVNDIDIKQSPCSIQETCCPPSNLISTGGNPGGSGNGGGNDTPMPGPQCGGRNGGTSTRIVSPDNTKETFFGEFPWMALLLMTEVSPTGVRTDNVFVCGASLLSPTIILTAAHCVNGVSIDALKVRVGEYDTHLEAMREPKPHQDRAVVQVVQHHNFHPKALYNDLALLVVSEPFILDTHISPICVPPLNTEFTETNLYDPSRCVATGWGKNAFGPDSAYPIILKKVDLSIVPNDQCQQQLRGTRLGQAFILDPSFVCAGGQRGLDTCEGDGGGPLVCVLRSDPYRYVQVGIVAWGIGCGNEIPSVYASLEANLDWLSVQFNRLILDVVSRFGNGPVNTKPGNSTKPAATSKPANGRPGTTVKPGTSVKSGTTVKPSVTSKPTTKSGKAV